jgi:hypothetical protein
MTDHITGGWLHLSDGTDNMYIKFSDLEVSWSWIDVNIKHYVSADREGTHYGYWFGGKAWSFKFGNLYFETYIDYQNFVRYLHDWQYDNQGLTLKVYRATGHYWAFDYTNESYTVMCKKGLPSISKKAGDQQIYVIKNIEFEQSG